MKRPINCRHPLYRASGIPRRLETSAANPAILVDGALAWLTRSNTYERGDGFGLWLERVTPQHGRTGRGRWVGMEGATLFIRSMVAVAAMLSEADPAARVVAGDRFEAGLRPVGRHLSAGRHTLCRAAAVHAPEATSL